MAKQGRVSAPQDKVLHVLLRLPFLPLFVQQQQEDEWAFLRVAVRWKKQSLIDITEGFCAELPSCAKH